MSEENWHRVAAKGDVAPEEPIRVQVGEEDIAIYNVDGGFHATSNICTHAYASMVDGFQEGEEIECPFTKVGSISKQVKHCVHRSSMH